MFSEITEVRDGIDQLTARAGDARGRRGDDRARWPGTTRYLAARQRRPQRQHDAGQQEGRPVQHRREGDGLDRQVRHARRSRRAVAGRAAARRPKGLVYAATPASDFICGTLQLAAGMNLHVFTTGRGTPYGLAEVPVIKVATRSDLARRWHDLMDVNAGTHRRRRGDDRGRRLGAVPPDARGGERPQTHLGRALEAAQRAGAVQSGAGDLSRRSGPQPIEPPDPLSSACLRAFSCWPRPSKSTLARRALGNISSSSSPTWWLTYSPSTLTLAS